MQIINWIIRLFGLVLLILFQVLVLNDLNVNSYIHPYVYVMFIIMLPFKTPDWILMIAAFVVGIVIDMFSNTPGMHAAACVAIAYIRPAFEKFYTPVTGYENVTGPSISELGFIWFLLFAGTLILIHHFIYFMIQVFWFHDIGYLLLKILLSTLLSTVLVIILAYLFSSRKIKS